MRMTVAFNILQEVIERSGYDERDDLDLLYFIGGHRKVSM